MFEKVNPSHPDKIADRIAGAIVDKAYMVVHDPKIAVEVLIGHGVCTIIIESNIPYGMIDGFKNKDGEYINDGFIRETVERISGIKGMDIQVQHVPQDVELARNQQDGFRCGDNGIFKGAKVTNEQQMLTDLVEKIYDVCPYDGKYLIDTENDKLIACQSNTDNVMGGGNWITDMVTREWLASSPVINPLGSWTGGIDVDSGATNRKLGSDMGDSVTGGGLHGKDLSKADVSINIFAWLAVNNPLFLSNHLTYPKLIGIAKDLRECNITCAIGDKEVMGIPYSEIVEAARAYINLIGGFEKFAEWGLIRPTRVS